MSRCVVLVAAVALATTAGCSGLRDIPEPPSLPATTASTAPIDLSQRELAPVPGETTTTIDIAPGEASLRGAVSVPEGLVPGAVVQVERLVGDVVATAQVTTGPDGRWALSRIKGGRYRVRAWRAPDLALTKPEVFFLAGDEEKQLDLAVERYGGTAVTWAIAPSPPVVDEPANLVVKVSARMVDERGIVRSAPLSGVDVSLVGSGDWRVLTSNPAFTDGAGDAQWQVQCESAGFQDLSVLVAGTEAFPLERFPQCAPAFTAPPTTEPDDGSTGPTTTTTRRPTQPRPTTTTTRASG